MTNTVALSIPTLSMVVLLAKWIRAFHSHSGHDARVCKAIILLVYVANFGALVGFFGVRIAFIPICFGPGGLFDSGTTWFHPVSAAGQYLLIGIQVLDGGLFMGYGVALCRELYIAKKPDLLLSLVVTITLSLSYLSSLLFVALPYLNDIAQSTMYAIMYLLPMQLLSLVSIALVIKFMETELSSRESLNAPLLIAAEISNNSESNVIERAVPRIYEI